MEWDRNGGGVSLVRIGIPVHTREAWVSEWVSEYSLTPHPTQSRSFRRRGGGWSMATYTVKCSAQQNGFFERRKVNTLTETLTVVSGSTTFTQTPFLFFSRVSSPTVRQSVTQNLPMWALVSIMDADFLEAPEKKDMNGVRFSGYMCKYLCLACWNP